MIISLDALLGDSKGFRAHVGMSPAEQCKMSVGSSWSGKFIENIDQNGRYVRDYRNVDNITASTNGFAVLKNIEITHLEKKECFVVNPLSQHDKYS